LFFDEPSAGLDPIIAAGIDQLILELKRAFRMTIIVVTHELASAFLIADRMLLIDKGNIVALGTVEEMRGSTQPRVRQFLDRVAEPEISGEMDYLQMLTAEHPGPRVPKEREVSNASETRAGARRIVRARRGDRSVRDRICHERCRRKIYDQIPRLFSLRGRH